MDIKNELPTITALGATGALVGAVPSLFFKKQKNKKLRNMLVGSTILPALYLAYASQRNKFRTGFESGITSAANDVIRTKVPIISKQITPGKVHKVVEDTASRAKDQNLPYADLMHNVLVQDPFERFNESVWNMLYPIPPKPTVNLETLGDSMNKDDQRYAALKTEYDTTVANMRADYQRKEEALRNWKNAHEAAPFTDRKEVGDDAYQKLIMAETEARNKYYDLYPDVSPEKMETIPPSNVDHLEIPEEDAFFRSHEFDLPAYAKDLDARYDKAIARWDLNRQEVLRNRIPTQNAWQNALIAGYGVPAGYLFFSNLFKNKKRKQNAEEDEA